MVGTLLLLASCEPMSRPCQCRVVPLTDVILVGIQRHSKDVIVAKFGCLILLELTQGATGVVMAAAGFEWWLRLVELPWQLLAVQCDHRDRVSRCIRGCRT